MDDKDREFVREVVRETVKELMRSGQLRGVKDIAYAEATSLLRSFYLNGEKDAAILEALKSIKADPYYKIIPLYFGYRYTIEEIAEAFGVEATTVSRNKKRLCLAVYSLLE